ncbi:hypothetical protein CK203_000824 [Vitis vinifera]|uniref:Uncharacterized protein n=1 Tax=Vitis vinifera TaxID=29760 RepID=A0A438KR61_VITVI|nr:hypothetical protein CK203_000824 [Vitis vinifera]
MGIVIESSVWEPKPSLYIFIFLASFLSIFLLPNFSNRTLAPFDHGTSPSFLRFQRNFLLIFSLASGHSSSFEWKAFLQCLESLSWLTTASVGSRCGQKKACLSFCVLHLSVGIWRRISLQPSVWLANICLSLATSIFSFSFETWMTVEHDKVCVQKPCSFSVTC